MLTLEWPTEFPLDWEDGTDLYAADEWERPADSSPECCTLTRIETPNNLE